ncbi:hypothetical protein IQ241_00250 [Romeria aff. gracilis LEGE 07310]|uniref:Uncharacterized protein n=1 Tax=Vasconcelosia minhoensis LEGE 07310 TaxID=915328 RepID=A0A8J7AJF8_9CYAN|nr:hypothetical protein [Romeria gracilis]MBE9075744.1 hypothetical protein [Romeria aff. gracilis LEGE 07310]
MNTDRPAQPSAVDPAHDETHTRRSSRSGSSRNPENICLVYPDGHVVQQPAD